MSLYSSWKRLIPFFTLTVMMAQAAAVPIASTYLGCFQDFVNNVYFLPSRGVQTWQTPLACAEQALATNNAYYGVEDSGQCFYGNSFVYSPTQVAESNCGLNCLADPTQKCGGSGYINLYTTSGNVTVPTGSTLLGCFQDYVNNVHFLGSAGVQTWQTPLACSLQAQVTGNAYYGVEFGGQCFYGNSYAYTPSTSTQCNMACQADPTQNCGGSGAIRLYQL